MNNDEIFWGTALWNFFHVLVNKINPESFHIIRVELLQIIHSICNNIDCVICQTHSVKYLEKNNFMHISSANELKVFFFVFHNSVNFERKKEMFLFENLIKYDNFEFSHVLQNILKYDYVFKKNIEIDFICEINKWFTDNIKYFEQT
jgi:hypothetical protein